MASQVLVNGVKMSSTFPQSISSKFWGVIALARQNYQQFLELIEHMDREGLAQFCQTYQEAAYELSAEPFLPYLNQRLSEDSLEDLFQWIVAQGRDYYMKILETPSSMPQEINRSSPNLKIFSDAFTVYVRRFGEEPPPPYEV